jgi:hypothetical protein
MRTRDLRAILFWVCTTAALLIVGGGLLHRWPFAVLAAAAWNAWLLSRPRMVRVLRRLSGQRLERESSYFRN